MALEKITFFRDDSQESAEAAKLLANSKTLNLLKRNNLRVVEIFANSDRFTPSLMKIGATYRGYDRISSYINSLNPSSQQS